jgi:hypothetical protein
LVKHGADVNAQDNSCLTDNELVTNVDNRALSPISIAAISELSIILTVVYVLILMHASLITTDQAIIICQ